MYRIESLLSARLFVSPQVVGDRIYFLSNMSGHLSLYAMDHGGSVPEPLLPPNIALQNPHLIGGYSFVAFPELGKILVMIDHDGDENYQPMLIPLEGGFPEAGFGGFFSRSRAHLVSYDLKNKLVYLASESRENNLQTSYRANLETGELVKLAESPYGAYPIAHDAQHMRVVIADGYTTGDSVLFLRDEKQTSLDLLYGIPLEQRKPGQEVPLNGIGSVNFTENGKGLLVCCSVFTDQYGPVFYDMAKRGEFLPVKVKGIVHQGLGELVAISGMSGHRYSVEYNIDGCSWLYEATFDAEALELTLTGVLVGAQEPLVNGMLASYGYDEEGDRFAVSFSTATSPTQIYTLEVPERRVFLHTREKVLGISSDLLSQGEDASFVSYDGLRISARLYLPADDLGFKGPRPLVYYIHGGPQGQERPDFAWFSMPLIQYLTLNGFAVFVPNVRGSTGYGLSYTKFVDRDWGGRDRLDHVHALQVLSKDARIDTRRAGVVGRSYGGYMTLTLAGRHPELWSAAVDMFGPFDMLTFMDRIPETWKPYFVMAVGDPVKDADFLVERSPKTYIDQIACPLLVIQGKNDPRVVERESHDLVEHLRQNGKNVDYLMFENEGHDVLKYENRVRCYEAITEYFARYLKP